MPLKKTLAVSGLHLTGNKYSLAGLKPRLTKVTSGFKRGLFLLFYKQDRASLLLIVFIVTSLAVLLGGFLVVFLPTGTEIKSPTGQQAVESQRIGVYKQSESNPNVQPYGRRQGIAMTDKKENNSSDVKNRTERSLNESEESGIPKEIQRRQYKHGVLMSCPLGQSQTHRGPWKPRQMILGVEAVIRQLEYFKSDLPLLFGYYDSELSSAERWCRNISLSYVGSVNVDCFQIPEQYPKGLYGYAKIFAIKHAPATEILWLDCDVYPVRPLHPLFQDKEFRKTGAMFWPDSRDFFNEKRAFSALKGFISTKIFPLDAWYVRQGFDSGIVLLNRNLCSAQIDNICEIARSTKQRHLRHLSMGDKDIFHVVWMMHGRNFTLIPYIGESGNIQTALSKTASGTRRSRRSLQPGAPHWALSSQVKYGRDGFAYALHQLHAQGGNVIVATMGAENKEKFMVPGNRRFSRYVQPVIEVLEDLRLSGGGMGFVGHIEDALILGRRKEGARVGPGVVVRRGLAWIEKAAAEMSDEWNRVSEFLPRGFVVWKARVGRGKIAFKRKAYQKKKIMKVAKRVTRKNGVHEISQVSSVVRVGRSSRSRQNWTSD